jgi:squalene-hopene/tetraprenyl-beta-curcumene cyclase
MKARIAVCLVLCSAPLLGAEIGAGWNPKSAAAYLDARQKEWFVWPRANAGAKPCVSCHTGVSYLLARPVLRKALGETGPTAYETGLLRSLRERVAKQDPPAAAAVGVESVMAALFLGGEGSPEARQALDRMWLVQIRDGASKGAWNWYNTKLDPWEMPESNYYGATLAAMAFAGSPSEYRAQASVKERMADLTAFLRAGQESQSLHNRLMLLWASTKVPELLTDEARRAILDAAWKAQQRDGSWTMEALGPFQPHSEAKPQSGASAYATAFTAYVLGQADRGNPKLQASLAWLRANQNSEGFWDADSMNHQYPAGSSESKFMRDAATAYACMALLQTK